MRGIEINGVKINLNDLDLSEIKAVLSLLDRANAVEQKTEKKEQKIKKQKVEPKEKRKYVKKGTKKYKPIEDRFDEIMEHIKVGKVFTSAVHDILGFYFSKKQREVFSDYAKTKGYVMVEHLSDNKKHNWYELKKRDELKANDFL